jgi:hypothetical protein
MKQDGGIVDTRAWREVSTMAPMWGVGGQNLSVKLQSWKRGACGKKWKEKRVTFSSLSRDVCMCWFGFCLCPRSSDLFVIHPFFHILLLVRS